MLQLYIRPFPIQVVCWEIDKLSRSEMLPKCDDILQFMVKYHLLTNSLLSAGLCWQICQDVDNDKLSSWRFKHISLPVAVTPRDLQPLWHMNPSEWRLVRSMHFCTSWFFIDQSIFKNWQCYNCYMNAVDMYICFHGILIAFWFNIFRL